MLLDFKTTMMLMAVVLVTLISFTGYNHNLYR